MKGAFLIVTGPSGSGKTTVAAKLLKRIPGAVKLLTATTRLARPGERDSVDYRFIRRDEFARRLERGEFFEHAEVYGNLYGSLRSDHEGMRERNSVVVAVVDMRGALFIKSVCPDAITVFLAASIAELHDRLEARGDMHQDEIARRLAVAERESSIVTRFDCVIDNGDGRLDEAVDGVISVLDIFDPE